MKNNYNDVVSQRLTKTIIKKLNKKKGNIKIIYHQ